MKKIGEYTAKGQVTTDNTLHRILLDDGSFETGFRVVEFTIAPATIDASHRMYTAKLRTNHDFTAAVDWNYADNPEIGWAMFAFDGNETKTPNWFNEVDEDNLVVQNLFIVADEVAQGGTMALNYIVKMEKYDIADWQGALGLVRNRSQG